MTKETIKDDESAQKAAEALVTLLEDKRRFTNQFNRFQSPLVRDELKEELEVIELKLNKSYKDLKAYYRKRNGNLR